eukprot:1186789-Prorocentrum_minimum.AAC.5
MRDPAWVSRTVVKGLGRESEGFNSTLTALRPLVVPLVWALQVWPPSLVNAIKPRLPTAQPTCKSAKLFHLQREMVRNMGGWHKW